MHIGMFHLPVSTTGTAATAVTPPTTAPAQYSSFLPGPLLGGSLGGPPDDSPEGSPGGPPGGTLGDSGFSAGGASSYNYICLTIIINYLLHLLKSFSTA